MKERYGLVFAGGGAKGSYQIGVWKALEEMNIDIEVVVGTSIGAINGAAFAQGDYDLILNVWEELEYSNVFTSKVFEKQNKIEKAKDLGTIFKELITNKGLDISPAKELLKKYIDEDKVRNSKIDFGLVTYSISERKPKVIFIKDIPKGELIDYIFASAAFPLFQKQSIDGESFIDGGFYDNMPINEAIKWGADKIIAVDLAGMGRTRKYDKDVEVITIKSARFLARTLQFENEIVFKNVELGYLDTLYSFNKFTGNRYYIQQAENNKMLFDFSQEELDKLLLPIGENIAKLTADRLIKYRILKYLKKYIKNSEQEISYAIACAEITADILGIEKEKVYTPDELAKEILEKYKNVKESDDLRTPLKDVSEILWDTKKLGFMTEEIKNILTPNIYAKIYKTDNNVSKFVSATLPALCIANLFIYLLLWREDKYSL